MGRAPVLLPVHGHGHWQGDVGEDEAGQKKALLLCAPFPDAGRSPAEAPPVSVMTHGAVLGASAFLHSPGCWFKKMVNPEGASHCKGPCSVGGAVQLRVTDWPSSTSMVSGVPAREAAVSGRINKSEGSLAATLSLTGLTCSPGAHPSL